MRIIKQLGGEAGERGEEGSDRISALLAFDSCRCMQLGALAAGGGPHVGASPRCSSAKYSSGSGKRMERGKSKRRM